MDLLFTWFKISYYERDRERERETERLLTNPDYNPILSELEP